MQALQILNTLCTLPLEKMNTFLLTCLYLSFTVYTRVPYVPQPQPFPRDASGRRLSLKFSPHNIHPLSAQFPTAAIGQYDVCRSDYVHVIVVRGYSHTLCRQMKHTVCDKHGNKQRAIPPL